jgi:serine protease
MRAFAWPCAVLTLLLAVLWPALSPAAESVVFRHQRLDAPVSRRIIVKWRAEGVAALQMPTIGGRATHLRAITGLDVSPVRHLFGQTDVMRLNYTPTREELQDVLARLNTDPAVEYAEPDAYRYIANFPQDAPPNDPLFIAGSDTSGSWQGQWYLQPSSASTPSALGVTSAWQVTTGNQNIVVAVIDTGIIEGHPDFTYPAGTSGPPKLQCSSGTGSGEICGYDFVSCDQGNLTSASGGHTTADCSAPAGTATYYFANDGHGWSADASDPGDWIDSSDTSMSLFQNAGCKSTEPSSWHGTKVAGVIGAVADNGIGIAGIAPMTTLLPVRALGKCTGRVSDIAAAILWAAGIGVAVDAGTIAASPHANIINLSLAAPMPCAQTEQDAINQAIAAGVLVVASAGNEGGPLDAPANCQGVLSVVGLREAGTKVPYSNVSSANAAASLAAPGGNCVNADTGGAHTVGYTVPCLYAIETTTDSGTTSPSATPGAYTYAEVNQDYQSYVAAGGNTDNTAVVGTSFAAPMVSGVAALMLAEHPGLSPSQLIARLQSSALPFPSSSSTTSTQCQLAPTTSDSNGDYTDTSQNIECACTQATCGAGMLNAAAAVALASRMYVQISPSSTTGSPGAHIRLDGSGSTAAAGSHIVAWQWTTDPATTGQLINPDQPIATLVVPTLRSISVMLTVTDEAGNTGTATVKIQSSLGASLGSGGAGALQPWLLLMLALALAGRHISRRRDPVAEPGGSTGAV